MTKTASKPTKMSRTFEPVVVSILPQRLAHSARTHSKNARSAVTNNPQVLPKVDGRGTWARRRRDLIRRLTGQVSQDRQCSDRDTLLIAMAASTLVRVEQVQAEIANGEDGIDDERLVRLTNTASRLLDRLGLNRLSQRDDRRPTLAEYQRSRYR